MSPTQTLRKPAIDMRAEIVSRPTAEMWEAMQRTEVDWYVGDQDPTVAELEARMAEVAGTEAAFFVATGGLANALALLALGERATQVVLESRCHVYWAEGQNVALLPNLAVRLVRGDRFGRITADELDHTLSEAMYGYAQRTSLVCLENTHNVTGGCALSPAETAALVEVAHRHGARVFVDGARLWNAAEHHGASLADLLPGVDAAMISLNKGLGAPVGAVLVGAGETVARAKADIRRLGSSGIHRMGYFAAAALVALDTMTGTFAEDHRRARVLAEGLAALDGLAVDLDTVQTNIVRVEITRRGLDAFTLVQALRERGVGARVLEPPAALKFHTYWEIDDDHVATVVETTRRVMAGLAR